MFAAGSADISGRAGSSGFLLGLGMPWRLDFFELLALGSEGPAPPPLSPLSTVPPLGFCDCGGSGLGAAAALGAGSVDAAGTVGVVVRAGDGRRRRTILPRPMACLACCSQHSCAARLQVAHIRVEHAVDLIPWLPTNCIRCASLGSTSGYRQGRECVRVRRRS
jgi:hypothetical protein